MPCWKRERTKARKEADLRARRSTLPLIVHSLGHLISVLRTYPRTFQIVTIAVRARGSGIGSKSSHSRPVTMNSYAVACVAPPSREPRAKHGTGTRSRSGCTKPGGRHWDHHRRGAHHLRRRAITISDRCRGAARTTGRRTLGNGRTCGNRSTHRYGYRGGLIPSPTPITAGTTARRAYQHDCNRQRKQDFFHRSLSQQGPSQGCLERGWGNQSPGSCQEACERTHALGGQTIAQTTLHGHVA